MTNQKNKQTEIKYVCLGDSYASGYDPILGYELPGKMNNNLVDGLSYASFLVYYWKQYTDYQVASYDNLGLMHARIVDWLYLLKHPTDEYLYNEEFSYFQFLNEWNNVQKPAFNEHLNSFLSLFYLFDHTQFAQLHNEMTNKLVNKIKDANILTISLGLFDFLDYDLVRDLSILIKSKNNQLNAFENLFDNLYLNKQIIIKNYVQLVKIIQTINPDAKIYLVGYLKPFALLNNLIDHWTAFGEQTDLCVQIWDQLANVIKQTANITNVYYINPHRLIYDQKIKRYHSCWYDLHPSFSAYKQIAIDLLVKTTCQKEVYQYYLYDEVSTRYLSTDENCFDFFLKVSENQQTKIVDQLLKHDSVLSLSELEGQQEDLIYQPMNKRLLTYLSLSWLHRYKNYFLKILDSFFSLFTSDYESNIAYRFLKKMDDQNNYLGYNLLYYAIQSELWTKWLISIQDNLVNKNKKLFVDEETFWKAILVAIFHSEHFNILIEIIFKNQYVRAHTKQWKTYLIDFFTSFHNHTIIINFLLYVLFNKKYNQKIKEVCYKLIELLTNQIRFKKYVLLFIDQIFLFQDYILAQKTIYEKIIAVFEVNKYLFAKDDQTVVVHQLISNENWWSGLFDLLIWLLPETLIRGLGRKEVIRYFKGLKTLLINKQNLNLMTNHLYGLLMHYDLIYLFYNHRWSDVADVIKKIFKPYVYQINELLLVNLSHLNYSPATIFILFDNLLLYSINKYYRFIKNNQLVSRQKNQDVHRYFLKQILLVLYNQNYDVSLIKDIIKSLFAHLFLKKYTSEQYPNILLAMTIKQINFKASTNKSLANNLLDLFKHLDLIFNDQILMQTIYQLCVQISHDTLFIESNNQDPLITFINRFLESLNKWINNEFSNLWRLICDDKGLLNTSITGLLIRYLKVLTSNQCDLLINAEKNAVSFFLHNLQNRPVFKHYFIYLISRINSEIINYQDINKKQFAYLVKHYSYQFWLEPKHVDQLINLPWSQLKKLVDLLGVYLQTFPWIKGQKFLISFSKLITFLIKAYQHVELISSRQKLTSTMNFILNGIKDWKFIHRLIIDYVNQYFQNINLNISVHEHNQLIDFFLNNQKFINLIKKFYDLVIIKDPFIFDLWTQDKQHMLVRSLFYLIDKYDLIDDWKNVFFELVTNKTIVHIITQFIFIQLRIDTKKVNWKLQKQFIGEMINYLIKLPNVNNWFINTTKKCLLVKHKESTVFYLGIYLDSFKDFIFSNFNNKIELLLFAFENKEINFLGLCDFFNTVVLHSPLDQLDNINPLYTPWYSYLLQLLLVPQMNKQRFNYKTLLYKKYLQRFYRLLWFYVEQHDQYYEIYYQSLQNLTLCLFAYTHQKYFIHSSHGLWHNKTKFFSLSYYLIKTITFTSEQQIWITNFLQIHNHSKKIVDMEKIVYQRLYFHLISFLGDKPNANIFLFLELLKQKK
ncbi:hypothetical protein OF377_00155 [Ureaplasma sp. ES3154-GEN]|uniref:hypothetical protein n=1 Tax=Ureaplasma sp. ES3154-GEN TaxID=2984844 RepID=UPI0021E6E6DE|nr:hypothetical protein [Ureaplasma sp. ES3154-GEN]MCV3743300.1 hypothetical protein [Ureaplasma sp. ES3154-GEN]